MFERLEVVPAYKTVCEAIEREIVSGRLGPCRSRPGSIGCRLRDLAARTRSPGAARGSFNDRNIAGFACDKLFGSQTNTSRRECGALSPDGIADEGL